MGLGLMRLISITRANFRIRVGIDRPWSCIYGEVGCLLSLRHRRRLLEHELDGSVGFVQYLTLVEDWWLSIMMGLCIDLLMKLPSIPGRGLDMATHSTTHFESVSLGTYLYSINRPSVDRTRKLQTQMLICGTEPLLPMVRKRSR